MSEKKGAWDYIDDFFRNLVGGAAKVHINGSDVLDPATWNFPDSITTTAQDMLSASPPNQEQYNRVGFTISGLTAETVKFQISLDDGTTFIDIIPIDQSTGVAAASVNLGNGNYYYEGMPFTHIQFYKSAAVENATVAYMVKV